jgi:GNAT superfamily N-acetyltransferase
MMDLIMSCTPPASPTADTNADTNAATAAGTNAATATGTNAATAPGTHAEVEAVHLRRATADDAAALALLGAATFLESFTWMLAGDDILTHCRAHHTEAAYARYLAEPTTRITLAVVERGAPVGFCMVKAPELPSFDVQPTDAELKRIYLFSRFRRAPVVPSAEAATTHPETAATTHAATPTAAVRPGQALMDRAIADARDLGATRLLLGTHMGNERAIRFYLRNGFTEAGRRSFQVGTQVCCDYIFARAL